MSDDFIDALIDAAVKRRVEEMEHPGAMEGARIDRMARAMWEAHCKGEGLGHRPWEKRPEEKREHWRHLARVAEEAR